MDHQIRHIGFVLAGLLLSLLVDAQQQYELTLEDCLQLAFENNLDLKRSLNDVKTAQVGLKESKFARLPNLNLQGGGNFFSGRVVDPTTNSFITENFLSNEVTATSSVTLFNGGRINKQITQSKLDKEIALTRKELTRDNLGLSVINAFLNVVLAQENLSNAEALLEVSQAQRAQLKQQVDVGSRAPNELLNLDVQIAQDEQNVINLINERDFNLLQLRQLIRWEGTEDIVLVPPPFQIIREDALDLYSFDVVYQAALTTMPSIQLAELNEDRADVQIDLAKTGFYPSLTMTGLLNTRYSDAARAFSFEDRYVPVNLRINGQEVDVEIEQSVPTGTSEVPLVDQWDQNLGYGVGVNLNIPIFNRWTNMSNVQRAKIQKDNADLDIQAARDNLKIDIQNALASARAARSNFEAAKRTLDATRASFDQIREAYEVGGSNAFELSQARTNFNNAQRSVSSSKYNYVFRVKVLDFYLGRNLNF
jgi:outer membrane protein